MGAQRCPGCTPPAFSSRPPSDPPLRKSPACNKWATQRGSTIRSRISRKPCFSPTSRRSERTFTDPSWTSQLQLRILRQCRSGEQHSDEFCARRASGARSVASTGGVRLSQILVTSRRAGQFLMSPLAMTTYYDIFVRRAFDNYYDILREVTFSPVMGQYLSHIGNQRLFRKSTSIRTRTMPVRFNSSLPSASGS